MIILIAGTSHTGKTLLAQRLLEKYHYPYLSIDHLKMGLIRSGNTDLTPMDDDKLTGYLWPIVREMIKTAIENRQNLVVEGCYIPFDWKKDFSPEYLRHIRYRCLIMTRKYIESHFEDIRSHGCDIEQRLDDSGLDMDELARDNEENLRLCREHGCPFTLLDEVYDIGLEEILLDHSENAEIWDAYWPDGSFAGCDLVRGEPIPDGLYHLVSEILVQHVDGDYLLMQRDPRKPNYGGYFEATAGGSALKGEDALCCAKRELQEETGIGAGTFTNIGRFVSHNTIYEIFLCVTDCEKDSVKLQEGETVSFKWIGEGEFADFVNSTAMIDVQLKRYEPYLKQMGYIR